MSDKQHKVCVSVLDAEKRRERCPDIKADYEGKKIFMNLLDQLQEIHNKGFVLGNVSRNMIEKDQNDDWHLVPGTDLYELGTAVGFDKEALGWKKQNRAPEYRRACLQGKKYYPTRSGDIYGLVYCIYEVITGVRPGLNFQLNRNWANPLEKAFVCDTDKKKAALQSLLDQCTQVSEYHRIQTCEQLKETKEYQILFPEAV